MDSKAKKAAVVAWIFMISAIVVLALGIVGISGGMRSGVAVPVGMALLVIGILAAAKAKGGGGTT